MQSSSITQHFYVRFIFIILIIMILFSDCIHGMLIITPGNAMCSCGDPAKMIGVTGDKAKV